MRECSLNSRLEVGISGERAIVITRAAMTEPASTSSLSSHFKHGCGCYGYCRSNESARVYTRAEQAGSGDWVR